MLLRLFAIAVFVLTLAAMPVRAAGLHGQFFKTVPPQPLPDFVFEDEHGQILRLADFRGHAVLLNLWASWCGPCVEEMPSLDALQGQAGNANLIVIAIDEQHSAPSEAEAFYKRHSIKNLKIYVDPTGRIASALHARGLPATFLIDANGNSIGKVEGGLDWTSPTAATLLNEQLSIKGKS